VGKPSSLLDGLHPSNGPASPYARRGSMIGGESCVRGWVLNLRSTAAQRSLPFFISSNTPKRNIGETPSLAQDSPPFLPCHFGGYSCWMNGEVNNRDSAHHLNLEFRKGCSACEHSDPELERELEAFAQLLLEIHLAKQVRGLQSDSGAGIDNAA